MIEAEKELSLRSVSSALPAPPTGNLRHAMIPIADKNMIRGQPVADEEAHHQEDSAKKRDGEEGREHARHQAAHK